MVDFYISPNIKGLITISDLLSTDSTISFSIDDFIQNSDEFLFKLEFEDFRTILCFKDNFLIFEKNGASCKLNLLEIPISNYVRFYIMWGISSIKIVFRYGNKTEEQIKIENKITPKFPSNYLISWARKQNLIPVEEYSSEEEFRNKIHSCLLSIQDKIDKSGDYFSFWNINYEKGRIINRSPKKEIEIHPIIHCILSDQFLMSSIEIIPEYHSSIGHFDFLFMAKIKNRGFAYFCVEFKNAHSDKLVEGLKYQLPSYLNIKNAKYGAYCVLDYRGEWFDKPDFDKSDNLDFYLGLNFGNIEDVERIRLFIYKLSKPIQASKIK